MIEVIGAEFSRVSLARFDTLVDSRETQRRSFFVHKAMLRVMPLHCAPSRFGYDGLKHFNSNKINNIINPFV